MAVSFALIAAIVGLAAAPAQAAPIFSVDLSRDQAEVSHSDQRVDYTVLVGNESPLAAKAGDELFCDAKPPDNFWFNDPTSFSFQWLANGVPLESSEDLSHGAQTDTYVVQSADAGRALQCKVIGSGTEANPPTAAAATVSLPAIVVDPVPSPGPPAPSNAADSTAARPTLTNEAGSDAQLEGQKRFCHPPANWSGTTSYSYQWLRNGQPIAGAEAKTSEYTPVEAVDKGTVLQCEVVGQNAAGAIVGISKTSEWATEKAPSNNTDMPTVLTEGAGKGPVSLELELPGGEGTYAFLVEGSGWACTSQAAAGTVHAKVSCGRTDPLEAEKSYPPLTVQTALGADAPDLAVARASFSGGGGTPVSDEDQFIFAPFKVFSIEAFEAKVIDDAGGDYTQAGGHPFAARSNFAFPSYRQLGNQGGIFRFHSSAHIKRVIADTPRGFTGNVLALPALCPSVQQVGQLPSPCPAGSVIGGISALSGGLFSQNIPIYAIEPEFGTPAQFAFAIRLGGKSVIFTFKPRLRAEDNYAVTLESAPSGEVPDIISVDLTLCGFGARTTAGQGSFTECKKASDADANPLPLITNPTRCGSPPPTTRLSVDTWENPGHFVSRDYAAPEVDGCEKVEFEPELSLVPTSHEADSPTGMDVNLTMPTAGLEGKDEEGNPDPEAVSQANLKSATVTLPKGMAVNASAGHGLNACTSAQIKLGTNDPISCPDGSKIGTVEIETPLIAATLTGSVYVAKQGDNPFGSLLGIYLVFDSKKDGLLIKVAGKVTPDPQTGQLVVSFDENPEAAFSAVRMHFPQGPRSPLLTPPKCGKYEIQTEFTPWNGGKAVTQTSSLEVTSGPGGSPCPDGGLSPKLEAGTEVADAGKASPFILRLSRDDGTQRFSAIDVHTPKGLTAILKGIPYCPDAALAGISSAEGTGQAQIDNPSCPAASQVGTASAGAGAGPDPFYVNTGKAYLAGPYKGAPLSLAIVAPAVAGPLDLGNVVVRAALHVDPETAQVSTVSDPVPTILHGILLDIRDIRVALDRPNFTLNPTNCEPKSVVADVKGEDGGAVSVSDRFQVGGCENLPFAPKLSVRLIGGTQRGGHPRLLGTLQAAPGDANIGRAAVTIPRSEFLDQAHIRTICTRVQFAADACPPGSIYGHAKATTPLLDYPVEGPVYLRSSNHKLPDLVVALKGPDYQPIEAVVVGRVDSIKGQIRTTFENAPDVPITKFELRMRGGNKGLLVNSRDTCAQHNRATVVMEGQNGKEANSRPAVINSACGNSRKAQRRSG
jgi:hypothetical protein